MRGGKGGGKDGERKGEGKGEHLEGERHTCKRTHVQFNAVGSHV